MSLPIQHLSYSAIKTFLKDRYAFRKQYILNIRDYKSGPGMVVGNGFHAGLECYYTDPNKDQSKATQVALAKINSIGDDKIDFGKTGNREDMLSKCTQLLHAYWNERPDVGEVLAVEKYITMDWEIDGVKGTIPVKAGIDLVTRKNGLLILRDHKSLTTFTDPETENAEYIMQAMFCFAAAKSFYNEEPSMMIYDEVKAAKNKDGSPQVRQYVVEYAKHPEYKNAFANLYASVCRELEKEDLVFLPNFSDDYTGLESFKGFARDTLSIEMPKTVHRTVLMPKFSEVKFNESGIDNYDNRNLEPQEMIKVKLLEFGIAVEPREIHKGANVTKYTFAVTRGVKMRTIEGHVSDIALALGEKNIRVEAPIPGQKLIGVEVPNKELSTLKFSEHFKPIKDSLSIPIGVDVYGRLKVDDLARMPHLLIAGSTGSGKSVMVGVIIQALIDQNSQDQLGLVLIDPKKVELAGFKNTPHLLENRIFCTEDEAINALNWACKLMDYRYEELKNRGYKNIDDHNTNEIKKMRKYVIVIDEFADLMTGIRREETEHAVIRLAQLARAAGIHMVIATQRPTVNVITGNIKTNMPTRIAFAMPQAIDSQTILGQSGAEDLLGRGDMLYMSSKEPGLQRLQGLFI